MHYLSHIIPPAPLHPHTHTVNLTTPRFPLSLHLPFLPKSSVSQRVCVVCIRGAHCINGMYTGKLHMILLQYVMLQHTSTLSSLCKQWCKVLK